MTEQSEGNSFLLGRLSEVQCLHNLRVHVKLLMTLENQIMLTVSGLPLKPTLNDSVSVDLCAVYLHRFIRTLLSCLRVHIILLQY